MSQIYSTASKALDKTTSGLKDNALPLLPLAIVGSLAIPYMANQDSDVSLANTFNDAQSRGETPMSDSYQALLQHRKQASMKAPVAATNAFGDVLQSLFMRPGRVEDVTQHVNAARRAASPQGNLGQGQTTQAAKDAIEKLRQIKQRGQIESDEAGLHFLRERDQFSLPRALATAGAAGAAGVGYNALTTSADNPLQYKIQKAIYGPMDREQLDSEFLRGMSNQGGKETASLIRSAIEQTASQAGQGMASIPRGRQQSQMMNQIMSSDDMLQDATPEDRELLSRAFQSMQKFAPELASDEFAVRNYLRESLMASNGPDYSTISNLARANRDVTDTGRR